MANARNNENQPSLFDSPNSSWHDYGGVTGGDSGHESPFVVAGRDIFTPVESGISVEGSRVAVNLADRAQALVDIMDHNAKANQVAGSGTQRPISDSQFNTHYGRKAKKVQEGADKKRAELNTLYWQGMRTLYPKDAMEEAGLVEDGDLGFTSFKNEMNAEFSGTGREIVAKRQAVIKQQKALAALRGFAINRDR